MSDHFDWEEYQRRATQRKPYQLVSAGQWYLFGRAITEEEAAAVFAWQAFYGIAARLADKDALTDELEVWFRGWLRGEGITAPGITAASVRRLAESTARFIVVRGIWFEARATK